jgi:hypothetical protein
MTGGMGGHQGPINGKDEWLTPPFILRALGPFDLDPCAPVLRPWSMATEHYTALDDGLSKPWFGRVWLNPPYGRPQIVAPWLRRMVSHNRGSALIFARTETEMFFEAVWNAGTAVLFIRNRLVFHHVDGRPAEHNGGAPSALVAYGADDADRLESCGIEGHLVRLR